MRDHNLLKQKLALIASSAVLADTVTNAIIDVCNLLDEYKAEIDHLRSRDITLKHLYRYGCLMRPPGPGAVPRDGFVKCGFEHDVDPDIGHHYWGWCDYERRLTDEEVSSYELYYLGEHLPDSSVF